jgi:nicotinate-nucleotide adenylyltransferase
MVKSGNKLRRIGILGGTFNPIHNGHLIMADEVYRALNLDKIIFVPTYLPPHKPSKDIAPARERLKMLKLALDANPHFTISDIEIKRKGKSYTIDTVKELKKKFKDAKIYFIIGSDYQRGLDKWKDVTQIQKLVKFVVVNRPRFSFKSNTPGVLNLNLKTVDVSGYGIRERIRKNRTIRSLVPLKVMRYIYDRGLYKEKN